MGVAKAVDFLVMRGQACTHRSSQPSHTAHISSFGRIYYRHHPLYGCEIRVIRRYDSFCPQEVIVLLPDQTRCALPSWMLDEAFCASLVEAYHPIPSVGALRNLDKLLDDALRLVPGVGKSHLVQAIGLEALKAGFVVLYRSIFDLVRELLTQETLAGEARLLKKYLKPDLLIIDDMGLKILPAKSGEILLEIIMRRYENRSTMMTSNRPIEEWGKLLSDVPAAGAILDRLLHHAEIIPINGRSYRLQPTAKQPQSKK